MFAAPSADRIDIAVYLLDADESAQTARLRVGQESPMFRRGRHIGR